MVIAIAIAITVAIAIAVATRLLVVSHLSPHRRALPQSLAPSRLLPTSLISPSCTATIVIAVASSSHLSHPTVTAPPPQVKFGLGKRRLRQFNSPDLHYVVLPGASGWIEVVALLLLTRFGKDGPVSASGVEADFSLRPCLLGTPSVRASRAVAFSPCPHELAPRVFHAVTRFLSLP